MPDWTAWVPYSRHDRIMGPGSARSTAKLARTCVAGALVVTLGVVLAGCSTSSESTVDRATSDAFVALPTNAQTWTIDPNYNVSYAVVDSELTVQFELRNNQSGWMAVAFNDFEFPADTIVAWYDPATKSATCWDAYNPGIPTLNNFPSPLQDTDPILKLNDGSPMNNQDNVRVVSSAVADGITRIMCERDLITGDVFDRQLRVGDSFEVWSAYNADQIYSSQSGAVQPMWTQEATSRWRI